MLILFREKRKTRVWKEADFVRNKKSLILIISSVKYPNAGKKGKIIYTHKIRGKM